MWYKEYKKVTKGIPAPLYYWKIIYDEKHHEGIAFLGLNDPHSLDVTDYLCPNICDEITWLKKYVPHIEIEEKGHMTCCTIKDLAANIDYIKNFRNEGGALIEDAEPLKKTT